MKAEVICLFLFLLINLIHSKKKCIATDCEAGCCASETECASSEANCYSSCYYDVDCSEGCCIEGLCKNRETCTDENIPIAGPFAYALVVALSIMILGVCLHAITKKQKKKRQNTNRTKNLVGVGQLLHELPQIKTAKVDNENDSIDIENFERENMSTTRSSIKRPEPVRLSSRGLLSYRAPRQLSNSINNIIALNQPESLDDYNPYDAKLTERFEKSNLGLAKDFTPDNSQIENLVEEN